MSPHNHRLISTIKKIIISNNLHNLLSDNELNALINHEKCHIKKHHLLKIFIAKYSLKKVSIYNFLLVEHSRKYLILYIFCKWRNKLETGFSVSAQKIVFCSGVTCFRFLKDQLCSMIQR